MLLCACLKATIYDYVTVYVYFLCMVISRKLYFHVNKILVYGRIIGHCSLVGILYCNQSTTHCLHQQPEDYCRRRLSQYSLLRLKSYFSASTGYSVPKATICTSMADVSVTPSSGSLWAFRVHAVSV